METLDFHAEDDDGAREQILEYVRYERDRKVIYFDGWDGFGASAVLRSIAQVLPSSKTSPELCFDRTIYIDCSAWKSRRAMQRVIAEELKLGDTTMAMFDKQDEEDDFHGVDQGSRDLIRSVAAVIHQTLNECRFIIIFLNGSDDEVDVETFGVPPFTRLDNNMMIWTFKRSFLTMHRSRSEIAAKLRYTHLFLSYHRSIERLTSSQFRALLHQEAATIVARHTCMRGIDPTMVADCCLYELFLHYNFHSTTKSVWAAHAPNCWICDGIIQEDRAMEIGNALHREISWECDASLLDGVLKKLMKHPEPPFLVVKDGDVYEEGPYRWISITSRNAEVHGMQTIPAATSSFFLTSESPDDRAALPNGLFEHSINLGVLVLSWCAFSFASPPFLLCHSLRFLGLDHCTDSKTKGGERLRMWAHLQSLWVFDLRYTDWDEILSEEKMDHLTNLRELNIEGVKCWQYTGKLQGRLPCLHKLRIIKPTCWQETSIDTNNSIMDKTKLQLLDLSGNKDMKILPSSLSTVGSLEVLILDGCDELENVVAPGRLPPSLKSFSLDGYGPASHWTPTSELPREKFRPSAADNKDVNISKISLEGCTQLENVFLRGLPNLVELDLSGTAIKILDFRTMVVEVPGLKRLFLLGCERLRAIRWGKTGSQIQPDLELLCVDTRPGIGRPRPSSNQNKPFRLQVHAIIVDARLAQSLWSPIEYHRDENNIEDVYFNICITSSPVYTGVVQFEAICKERIGPSDQASLQQLVPTGRYTEVFTEVLDAPMQAFPQLLDASMQAFPQPPTPQSDRHIEMNSDFRRLISFCAESLHVHDVSTNASMPRGDWKYLRRCQVERCPKMDTVFPSPWYDFISLENFWASDLLMARCIWSKHLYRIEDRSFGNLQHLHLRSCPRLQFVLPVRVSSFPSLETLHIIHWGDLRHVFVLDGSFPEEIAVHGVAFPKLTTIHLHDLPTLRQICEVKMVVPALETIRIRGCSGLRRLPAVAARGADEKKPAVEIEKDVWDTLEWDGVEAGHDLDLFEAPIHTQAIGVKIRGTDEKKPAVEIEKDVLEWDGVEAGHNPDLFKAPIHSRYYKKKLPRVSVLR